MSMSTPINQIRSRMTTNGGGSGNGNVVGVPSIGTPMVYDPNPPVYGNSISHDPNQLGTTFPVSPQMPSSDNDGMLEDILREMERSSVPNTVGPDPNVGLMNYAINPVNIPPPMSPHAKMQLQSETTHVAAPVAHVDENIRQSTNTTLSLFSGNELTGSVLGRKIISSVKPLLLVFIIVLVLSLHQTNRFLFSFFPQLLLENGQLSIYAILLRCTIAVLLFYTCNLIF